jgi:hypothetical protein
MPYGVDIIANDNTIKMTLEHLLSDIETISIRVRENDEHGRIIFNSADYEDVEGSLINSNTIDEFNLIVK